MKNLTIKDYSITHKSFELMYDESLELYHTQFDDWERVEEYYQSSNYISHTDSKNSIFDKIYAQVKKYTIQQKWKQILSCKKEVRSVLDIGCGTGDFLVYAKQIGLQTKGVEPNTKAQQLAKEKSIDVVSTFAELPNQKYDVITLWHVLEHVPNYDEYIVQLKQLLNPDGLLIIAVPNFNSYDAKYYQNFWAAWDVPRHIWHFSKKAVQQIVSKHGFQLIQIKPMYFDAFYISLLSEEYKTESKNPIKAFSIGLLSNIKAFFSKEYSSNTFFYKKLS
ncbi:class I SAM-dependent methyltransferase [Capnocytophaga sp. ARDL2]|uniref:class I SAM-dependent methyltransferase n=1 Tax=Capnocytophaga sp. ARDL2 TaxID=3238809 RepID=UPI00355874C6